MFVRYHMTMHPKTITPEQTVAQAAEILEQNNFRHLPVVNEAGILQGMVTDRDLRSAWPSSVARSKERHAVEERVRNTAIAQIMTPNCLSLTAFATLDDALLLFQSRKIGALPVVNDDNMVVGIFSNGDMMEAYRCLFGLGEKGSALISIKDQKDPQVMSKLLRLMEEKNIRFTRLLRADGTCDDSAMIYLRIQTYNIRAVYKTLEKAGFEVHRPEMEPASE